MNNYPTNKMLQEIIDGQQPIRASIGYVMAREILELRSRIAALEEVSRWIPVSERLPEKMQDSDWSEEVLGITYKNQRRLVWYDYTAETWKMGVGAFWERVYPTHWMPLPQPPESEG